ncbi:UNKNOWN [Stylonychia lemnae]|uniref:Uncharacterized protein n=1 Tax=Stylonychia lemnae TaxID=5949 RepID=A0A078B9I7_STYLE|nr:UNKNOWN [Stylonychia lemnae]|eukprot:CDW89907.1 UNKNOWN [Stylonychia lemnae]
MEDFQQAEDQQASQVFEDNQQESPRINENDKSNDSIPTDELTDLYNSSEEQQIQNQNQSQNNLQPYLDVQASYNQTQMLQISHNIIEQMQSPSSKKKSDIEELKQIIELQKVQLDRMQNENVMQQSKIDKLTTMMTNQNDEIQVLKRQMIIQPGTANTLSLSNQSSLSKITNFNSQSLVPLSQNQLMINPRQSDFWKENDQEFYTTKNPNKKVALDPINRNKNLQVLDEIKQELWVSKERQEQQKVIGQNLSKSYKDSRKQLDQFQDVRVSQKKKEKLKSNTLKKASKKVFNEDLVEIGETLDLQGASSRVLSDQRDSTTENRSVVQLHSHQQNLQIQRKKNASQIQEQQLSQSVKRQVNPNKINKLEALKFKMQLQARNLKLIKEHDFYMRDIEKKQRGGQRENKQQTMHTVTRLYRDLERTQKQLKQELQLAERSGDLDEELLAECEGLFQEVDDYFRQQQREFEERKVKKDYTKVSSRINSNLKGIKHNKLVAISKEDLNQQDEMDDDIEDQQLNGLSIQPYDRSKYHQSNINSNRGRDQYSPHGDVGSSNYNNEYPTQGRGNVKLPQIISNRGGPTLNVVNNLKNSNKNLSIKSQKYQY